MEKKEKQKNELLKYIIFIVIFLVILAINRYFKLIVHPTDLISYNFSLLTISTVLLSFSFTELGLLISFSSNKLIEKLRKTTYLEMNIRYIRCSCVFFLYSIVISLLFVLGIIQYTDYGTISILFILCIEFLIFGFFYFACALYYVIKITETLYKVKKLDNEKFLSAVNKSRNSSVQNGIQDDTDEF